MTRNHLLPVDVLKGIRIFQINFEEGVICMFHFTGSVGLVWSGSLPLQNYLRKIFLF